MYWCGFAFEEKRDIKMMQLKLMVFWAETKVNKKSESANWSSVAVGTTSTRFALVLFVLSLFECTLQYGIICACSDIPMCGIHHQPCQIQRLLLRTILLQRWWRKPRTVVKEEGHTNGVEVCRSFCCINGDQWAMYLLAVVTKFLPCRWWIKPLLFTNFQPKPATKAPAPKKDEN